MIFLALAVVCALMAGVLVAIMLQDEKDRKEYETKYHELGLQAPWEIEKEDAHNEPHS